MGELSTWPWGSLPKRGLPALSSRVSFQKDLGLPRRSGAAPVVPCLGLIKENEGF